MEGGGGQGVLEGGVVARSPRRPDDGNRPGEGLAQDGTRETVVAPGNEHVARVQLTARQQLKGLSDVRIGS
jgi:hypothetical protein